MNIWENLFGILTLESQSIDVVTNNKNLTFIASVLLIIESILPAISMGIHYYIWNINKFDRLFFIVMVLFFLVYNSCCISFLILLPITRSKGIKLYIRALGFSELFLIIGSLGCLIIILLRSTLGIYFFIL